METSPVITLLTDFGQQDAFVGIMKGVMLRLCPSARLVDLSHETEPFDILGGSFLLRSAMPYVPAGTIHLAVVDPGVGGPRRPILAQIDDQFFVVPDNGLLSYPMSAGRIHTVRHVTAEQYFLHPVSATFHGRDIFAPIAAHLALGILPEQFGPEIHDAIRLPVPLARQDSDGTVHGQVIRIDHFGNCITNITRRDLDAFMSGERPPIEALLNGQPVGPLVEFFEEAGAGGEAGIIGSTGCLELFALRGNLARRRSVHPGAPVRLERRDRQRSPNISG